VTVRPALRTRGREPRACLTRPVRHSDGLPGVVSRKYGCWQHPVIFGPRQAAPRRPSSRARPAVAVLPVIGHRMAQPAGKPGPRGRGGINRAAAGTGSGRRPGRSPGPGSSSPGSAGSSAPRGRRDTSSSTIAMRSSRFSGDEVDVEAVGDCDFQFGAGVDVGHEDGAHGRSAGREPPRTRPAHRFAAPGPCAACRPRTGEKSSAQKPISSSSVS
jgi:hypothetical protein